MKIVADESVDKQIVDELRNAGHTVTYVAEFHPALDDEQVLAKANRESAVLLTADKDFGELVFRQLKVNTGVILLRLAGLLAADKSAIVLSALKNHAPRVAGNFCVISPKSVRIRRSGQ